MELADLAFDELTSPDFMTAHDRSPELLVGGIEQTDEDVLVEARTVSL